MEVHPRAHFVFNASLALNFSFVLRFFDAFAGFIGFTGFGLHVMGWCSHSLRTSLILLYWSMIRRTDYEFLLQLERSACIAITILVRLQQVNRTLID